MGPRQRGQTTKLLSHIARSIVLAALFSFGSENKQEKETRKVQQHVCKNTLFSFAHLLSSLYYFVVLLECIQRTCGRVDLATAGMSPGCSCCGAGNSQQSTGSNLCTSNSTKLCNSLLSNNFAHFLRSRDRAS